MSFFHIYIIYVHVALSDMVAKPEKPVETATQKAKEQESNYTN